MASFRNKDHPMTGNAIYRSFQESRKKMRMIIIPLLPATFTTMKSGKAFHETCKWSCGDPLLPRCPQGNCCKARYTMERCGAVAPTSYVGVQEGALDFYWVLRYSKSTFSWLPMLLTWSMMSLTLSNQDRGQAKCSGCCLQCYTAAQETWWHCPHDEFHSNQ